MLNTETIFLDESGTPAVSLENGLFVVGGFSVRGDTNHVLLKWDKFLKDNDLLGKKGRKYTIDNFLSLSEFMCSNRIIPLASHSRLSEYDLDDLDSKIIIHNEIASKTKKDHQNINPHDYIWSMQVAITVVSSILSLLINRDVISKVQIAIDKYLKQKRLQGYVSNVLEKFFNDGEINKFFMPLVLKYPTHPDIQNFFNNFKPDETFISLSWNARGKLDLLADAVCSLYKRSLKRKSEERPAWDILKICFTKNEKTPSCIGYDLTSAMKNIIQRPWIP